MVTTTNTTRTSQPKSTYKELKGGGFEFNGRQFTKEGKEVVKSGGGVYYNIDEPNKDYVREGDTFKEVAISQKDKENIQDITYGRPKRLGDTISGSNNKAGVYQESNTSSTESGVLTASVTEANYLKPRSELPIWTVSSVKPSEAVQESKYASAVPLYKDPLGYGQTAGSYEYNVASINLYEKASRGITIDAKQIQASKEYARQERLSGDPTKNVRLVGNELKVWTARQGVGFLDFNLNLLATIDGVPWGTVNLNDNIAPSPTVPSISKGVGGWIKELPNRPSTTMDITLAGSLIGSTIYSGVTSYNALRASGVSRLGAVDIMAGETLSSFSPYGKIESGIKGAYIEYGATRQITGAVDTIKLGELGATSEGVGKGVYSSLGQATYYTPKTLVYGSVQTTLSQGTVGTINTISAFDYEIVKVAGLTSATTSELSSTYSRGYKVSTQFGSEFEAIDSYNYGVINTLQVEAKDFKSFGLSKSFDNKISLGKSNNYYRDAEGLLNREVGNTFGKNLKEIDYENFKVTLGRSGAIINQEGDLTRLRANTRYIEAKGRSSIPSSIEEQGAGEIGGKSGGSKRGVVNTQLKQKSLIESSITRSLEPQALKNSVVSKSLVKSLSLGGGSLAFASSSILANKGATSLAPLQPKQLMMVKQVFGVASLSKIAQVTTPQLTGVLSSVLNSTLNPNLTGGGFGGANTPSIPITSIPLPIKPDLELGSSSRGIGSKVVKGYTPSFNALVFKIRGSKPRGTETGLRVRPITRGFSWSRVLNRR